MKNGGTHHSRGALLSCTEQRHKKKVLNQSHAPELSLNTEGLRRGEEMMGGDEKSRKWKIFGKKRLMKNSAFHCFLSTFEMNNFRCRGVALSETVQTT